MPKDRIRFRARTTVPALPNVVGSRGASSFFGKFADVMGDLNSQIQARADKRAVKRATKRGLVAGRDPQFKTIEGEGIEVEAFNQSALDTFANRLEIRARAKAGEIYDKNLQDPKQLDEALGNYAMGVQAEIPGELLEGFNLFWSKNTAPLMEAATKESRRIARNAQAATLSEVVDSKIRGAERMSFVSDDDLVYEANIEGERNDLFLKMVTHGPPQEFTVAGQTFPADPRRMGIVDPNEIVKQMEQFDRRVAMSRVMGKFDNARKQGEAAEFARDWIDNPVQGFSNEERAKLSASMKSAISSDEAINKRVNDEAKAAQAIASSKRAGDLKREVAAGRGTEEMIEAAFPQDISGDERARLLIQLDDVTQKQNKAIADQQRVAFAMTAGLPLDAKNPEDRKAVDAYFAQRFGNAPPTAETMTEIVDFIRDVAVIPTVTRGAMRSLARSSDPAQAVLAADMIARIQAQAPQVLETLPKDEKAFSLLVSGMVASGTEPAVAVELARLRVYETPASEMEQLRKVFTEKGFDGDNEDALNDLIDDEFDPVFRLQPNAPASMIGEYDSLVEQYYIRTRDEEVARKLAGQDLIRVWGVSDTVGTPFAGETGEAERGRLQMVKYPPEKANGNDGSRNKWMRKQLEQEAKALNVPNPDRVFLISDDRTAREKTRSWQVWHVRKEDGRPVPVLTENNRPFRWRPQFDISDEGKTAVASKKQSKARSQAIHLERVDILSEGTVAEQLFGIPAAERPK